MARILTKLALMILAGFQMTVKQAIAIKETKTEIKIQEETKKKILN